MRLHSYSSASDFLARAQRVLEENEAANNLMLGLAVRLNEKPRRVHTVPYLATVDNHNNCLAAALMTPPQKLVVFSHSQEPEQPMRAISQHLFENQWNVPGVTGPTQASAQFAQAWCELTGQTCEVDYRMRTYVLHNVNPPDYGRGNMRLADLGDLPIVARWVVDFQDEAMHDRDAAAAAEMAAVKVNDRDVYLWLVDGQIVSMAAKTRPTQNGIVISLVYTPPEQRGKGYASALVARMCQMLLDSGKRHCALFADLENPTSNHIYQQIGFTPLIDYAQFRFLPA
jgi:predicted GNAT family acetyltransferase